MLGGPTSRQMVSINGILTSLSAKPVPAPSTTTFTNLALIQQPSTDTLPLMEQEREDGGDLAETAKVSPFNSTAQFKHIRGGEIESRPSKMLVREDSAHLSATVTAANAPSSDVMETPLNQALYF
jgi:hypothetical protein